MLKVKLPLYTNNKLFSYWCSYCGICNVADNLRHIALYNAASQTADQSSQFGEHASVIMNSGCCYGGPILYWIILS